MQLHLHPTRREALTASATAIRRWSLETNPATILAEFSTAPEWLFTLMYDAGGQAIFMGEITSSPDGKSFALSPLQPHEGHFTQPNVIEWRRWDDLLPARSSEVPNLGPEVESLASSPDGRWLVIGSGYAEQLFLLDWQTGEIISHHATDQYNISGLIFDPTSTFLAGLISGQGSGLLQLWRLDPAERFVPRPAVKRWPTYEPIQQDYVCGSMALTPVHRNLDSGVPWHQMEDIRGAAAFSPDSRLVIFSYYVWHGFELLAYEVASGTRLWCARSDEENTGQFILSPDGSVLLVPVEGGDLLVYRVENGELMQRLPSGLNEPIQALAFDHDGRTLWLATEEALVQYQPKD
ncbi:MAG TPA: WD40 repeat domain-containing protein [Ktedonobacterales bacterium]